MSFLLIDFKRSKCEHSHKKRNDSLETRTEPAVLRTYVDNQAVLSRAHSSLPCIKM